MHEAVHVSFHILCVDKPYKSVRNQTGFIASGFIFNNTAFGINVYTSHMNCGVLSTQQRRIIAL